MTHNNGVETVAADSFETDATATSITYHREGTTILMVTHSKDCAVYAERILQVSDGRLIEKDA